MHFISLLQGKNRRPSWLCSAALALAAVPCPAIALQSENSAEGVIRFPVLSYLVRGNTLLNGSELEALLSRYAGTSQTRDDIALASQALEQAYRDAGFHMVRVVTPQQDITDGTVTLEVAEYRLGRITVSNNLHHDQENVLAALPSLVAGGLPSTTLLAQNMQLANENPSRHIEVTLALGEQAGVVDASVNVQDEPVHKVSLTLDNTGNANTGKYRTGVSYQHNNLFNRDHAATISYTTSPDHIGDVMQVSASYRLPLYTWGDSLDFIAAYSDVNAGTTTTVAGPMTFSGKGQVYGAHYNHHFARLGEYSSRATASLDYRAYANSCQLGGFGAAGCGSAATDTTVHPISLSYSGVWRASSLALDFSASASHNLPGGSHAGDTDFAAARPSPLGSGGAGASYTVLQLNASALYSLPQDWQLRVAVKSQTTRDALIAGEQFGLAGANAVRGLSEREAARDKGYVFNLEATTPDLVPRTGLSDSALRLVLFADYAHGWNELLAGEQDAALRLGSLGLGLRYEWGRRLSARLDWARVSLGGAGSKAGDSRAHLSAVVNF